MLVCPAILFWTLLFEVLGRWYCQCLFSHILLFGRCYCHGYFCGRCYTTRSDVKPVLFSDLNVIATCFISYVIELTWWEDVIAIDLCDWCYCHILVLIICDWSYCHILMLLLFFGRCYAIWWDTTSNCCIGQFCCPWLMLLPLIVLFGWCCCHIIAVHIWLVLLPWWLMENPPMGVVADVIAKVADGIATGSML